MRERPEAEKLLMTARDRCLLMGKIGETAIGNWAGMKVPDASLDAS